MKYLLLLALAIIQPIYAHESDKEVLVTQGIVGAFDVKWSGGKPAELMWDWGSGELSYELASNDFFVAKPYCYKKAEKIFESTVYRYHCQLSPLSSVNLIPDFEGSDIIEVKIQGTDETHSREVWNFTTAWIRESSPADSAINDKEQLQTRSMELVLKGPRATTLHNYQVAQGLSEIRFKPESVHKLTCALESRKVRSGRSRMRIVTKTEDVCRISFELKKSAKIIFSEN